MIEWLQILEASDLTALLRSSFFLIPALEALHLVGLAMFVGGAASIDLYLLSQPNIREFDKWLRSALPWARVGFALLIGSGLLLFAESPIELYLNSVFRIKLALIGVGLINVLIFHRLIHPQIEGRYGRWKSPIAIISLCVWLTVIVFGRLITYV